MTERAREGGREGRADAPTERESVWAGASSPLGALVPGADLGGRYRIVSWVGVGGMGEVWRAFDLKLRVDVALKALREDLIQDERRRELLRQEVRAAREVVSPNVCRIFDLVEAGGRELVSMEYVDGQTLLRVLQERGPLELKEAQDIASQFLAGLEAIHAAGLVHRDVKPENIMLTRTGRVVVMDFGLARSRVDPARSASGTPAYMAPEQARGEADGRADLYSAGVVLAEMVCPEGVKDIPSRESVWDGVRADPPKLADTPWAPVLRKAVARQPDQRYGTAHALARALEEVTLRVVGGEDLHPYPGLASFTEADAEFFFGREAEVEQMWRKLEGPARLLGLAGPSGAGKSSFLRAGLTPSARPGWAIVICTPGSDPLASLRRAVISELGGDTEALRELAVGSDDASVAAIARWRRHHDHALVIVDQFEELFTQTSAESQSRFGRVLARLALEGDAHVLLSIREDFLLRCHDHEPLEPLFSELTPLAAPAGAALRRALTQPALRCGYRFEDEALVAEMLAEVEGERGALPLLAFAAARLWEKRDRDDGLLTRQAHLDIGGVGGALAQHAEATMDRIGSERVPIVRELFRNLVTAEGTRAVREWDELLSVFADSRRESAREVLRALVDARLLTSYELRREEGEPTRQVEVIHESLISHWPRLQRWQTQDADAAQLRDQLRQAARTWAEHGRTDDMLWTGSAYREFAVWREHYPGGLTELEEAFASAMTLLATRRRRQRRTAAACALTLAIAVAAVFGALWRRADLEADQREAAQLLALGQLRLADDPNAALAYATASLERADNGPARRFAVEALWQGPPALFIQDAADRTVGWSPDGRWFVLSGSTGLVLLERGTTERRQISSARENWVGFTSDGRRMVTDANEGVAPKVLHVWALPEGVLERTLGHAEGAVNFLIADRLLTFSYAQTHPEGRLYRLLRELPLDGAPATLLGVWGATTYDTNFDIDTTASWVLSLSGGRLVQQHIDALSAPGRPIGAHEGEATVWCRPWRDRAVTGDSNGEVRIWDVASARLERALRSPGDARIIARDPNGRYIAAGPPGAATSRSLYLFDLAAPRSAEPLLLLGGATYFRKSLRFSPDGSWLAADDLGGVILWSMAGARSIVLGRQSPPGAMVTFTPDGNLLSASNEGILRFWPISPAAAEGVRELWSNPGAVIGAGFTLEVDPAGRFAVLSDGTGGFHRSQIRIVPVDGSPPLVHELWHPEGRGIIDFVGRLDPSGRHLATSVWELTGHPELNAIRILDLATGDHRTLDTHADGEDRCADAGSEVDGWATPVWLPDGRLVSDGDGGLRVWDLDAGTSRVLRPCSKAGTRWALLLATPDSRLVLRLDRVDADPGVASSLSVFDLESLTTREVASHGNQLRSFAIDATGTILVTGGADGVVRVGLVSGDEPHLLYGHTEPVTSVAVSPDGRWIASGGDDGMIRLWPMPDLTKPALHTLPHDELLAKLKSLTNLRAVRDPASDTGYTIEIGPFPGWATVPEWQP